MTIAEALRAGTDRLAASGVATPRLEAELLLETASGQKKQQLLIYSSNTISDEVRARHRDLVARRCRREPLQQILGETEFYGLKFLVNEHVMAPRPETEILVEQVIKHWRTGFRTILDIGTGSGCIAIALAKNLPECRVDALDISEKTLETARRNISLNGLAARVKPVLGDLFPDGQTNYDAIVSNPPYIPTAEIDGLMPEVSRHEPRIALDGGPDGLDFYRRISAGLGQHLKRPGMVALEVGAGQAGEVTKILSNALTGLNIEVMKDLAGIERVIVASREKYPITK
jgi:release factor glutamine methyltransferase